MPLALGSFADEIGGHDADSLKEIQASPRIFGKRSAHCSSPAIALAGATVAHELTHRNSKFATLSAYLSFVIYHIYAHHRQVGTYQDAATARRGERLRTFMARTLTQQFAQAAHIEVMRLKHLGFSPYSWLNRLILAHLVPLAILVLALIVGGWRGVLVIVLGGVIGRSFHELINYVQHFGLVRVENSPIRPHHSWDCYRTLSNALHYSLPRHSDHHMFGSKALPAARYAGNRADFTLWLSDHGLNRAHSAALAPHHETIARRLGRAIRERR